MDTRLYTLDETISNLVLLEPHFRGLASDKLWCMDCITKHTYAIRGLSTEGVKFFSENPEPWEIVGAWSMKVLDMGDISAEEGLKLADETEDLRKAVFVPMAKAERSKGSTELVAVPSKEEARKTIAAGGGVYIGLQERVDAITGAPRSPVYMFNDAEGGTLSTMVIDPAKVPMIAESIRSKIKAKRLEAPAPKIQHKKPTPAIFCGYCGAEIKGGGPKVQHGICPKCLAEHFPQYVDAEAEIEQVGLPEAKEAQVVTALSQAAGSPGFLVDEEKAKASPCTRIRYDGSEWVYSSGIVGALDPGQKVTYCPLFKDVEPSEALKARMRRFQEGVKTCKVRVADLMGLAKVTPYLECMREVL